MSRFHPMLTLSYLASAAISAYTAVKLASDTTVAEATDPGDYIIGVSGALDIDSGEPCPVIAQGVAEMKAGGAITRGQLVTCDSNGDAVATDGFTMVTAVVAGSTAGAITVTGIKTTDELVSVVRVDLDSTAANIDVDDLLSETTITDADEITTTTTNTTGDKLLVTYKRPITVIGRALASAVDNDIFPVLLGR